MTTTTSPGDGAPLAAAVQRLSAAAAAVAELVVDGALESLTPGALLSVTAELHRVVDRTRAVAVDATNEVRVGDVAREEGFATVTRWLEVRARLAPSEARATLARAESLQWDFARTREAWLAGEIGADAVREITTAVPRAVRALPSPQRDDELRRIEATALSVARTRTVADVRRVIARARIVVDPAACEREAVTAQAREYLSLVPVADGVELRGFLSATSAAVLLTALDRQVDTLHRAGEQPPEPRSVRGRTSSGRRATAREQQNARALVDVVGQVLGAGLLGTRHAVRPHVTLTVHADDLRDGLGGDLLLPGFGPLPVPPSTVRRLLCDAEVHPVLTRRRPRPAGDVDDGPPGGSSALADAGGHSDPPDQLWPMFVDDLDDDESWLRRLLGEGGRHVLDVGRSFRTAPPAIRRALEVRDQHCAFPDCRIDASRCEAHHVRHWEHGGATSLDNLVLICVRHHHLVHEGRWVARAADGADPGVPRFVRFDQVGSLPAA